ncbi:MAG: CPBP family intramembrane glutamic endopeptidase [Thermoanaerobaculia bacterium]
MNRPVFVVLLIVGSLGILISFARARSRAVFDADGFVTPGRRAAAFVLLALVLLLTVAVPFAGGLAGGGPDASRLNLVSLFAVQGILLAFLACYFALSGHRSPSQFLKLASPRPVADFASGLLIGSFGWLVTLLGAAAVMAFWLALRGQILAPRAASGVPSTILWILAQPLWARLAIVVSAMVVEELFFRSFLQTRVGPLAATLMFTAAHGVYGQPLLLVGILVISTVMSVTFARYGNVLPCIAAHGAFDAIQMFVVIPRVAKLLSGS